MYDVDANEWTRLKDLPFPRCHHAAIAMVSGTGDVSVYITGGFNKEKTVLSSSLRCVRSLVLFIYELFADVSVRHSTVQVH